MEEQLQLALAELLNGAIAAKDFVLAEAPLVIQDLLRWKLTWNVLSTVLNVTLVAVAVKGVLFSYKKGVALVESTGDGFDAIGWAGVGIFSAIAGLVYLTVAVDTLKYALMIAIAPKVYLIEYAAWLAR